MNREELMTILPHRDNMLLLDRVDQLFQTRLRNRTLFAGLHNAGEQLVAVIGFSGAVALDQHKRQAFYRLISGKPFHTFQALTSAADAGPLVRRTRVDDLAVGKVTEWTFHTDHSLKQKSKFG